MSNKGFQAFVVVSALTVVSCQGTQTFEPVLGQTTAPKVETITKIDNRPRVVHILVALCDNENQGIVPVPKHLGNGEDPPSNLYWGAGYGVKTFFSKSKNWQKIGQFHDPKANVLQRIVFKHRLNDVYLVADAYRGSRIKETIEDFFSAASGNQLENIEVDDVTLQVLGSADLIGFVGHNGLMDFKLATVPTKHDDQKRETIILACASRNYFLNHLKGTGAEPLLWTTNLMAPEAYTLHDAIEAWIKNESAQDVRIRAAAAYARYQKISERAAQGLLVTGW